MSNPLAAKLWQHRIQSMAPATSISTGSGTIPPAAARVINNDRISCQPSRRWQWLIVPIGCKPSARAHHRRRVRDLHVGIATWFTSLATEFLTSPTVFLQLGMKPRFRCRQARPWPPRTSQPGDCGPPDGIKCAVFSTRYTFFLNNRGMRWCLCFTSHSRSAASRTYCTHSCVRLNCVQRRTAG